MWKRSRPESSELLQSSVQRQNPMQGLPERGEWLMDNFIEIPTVQEANKVDLDNYVFLERLSAKRGKYCFKIREAKR